MEIVRIVLIDTSVRNLVILLLEEPKKAGTIMASKKSVQWSEPETGLCFKEIVWVLGSNASDVVPVAASRCLARRLEIVDLDKNE